MTQILDDEKVVLSTEEDTDDGMRHLVHEECHVLANPRPEFVTALCGLPLDWDEKNTGPLEGGRIECPACEEQMWCPVCGTPRWRLG
jgi:hypothetical protein